MITEKHIPAEQFSREFHRLRRFAAECGDMIDQQLEATDNVAKWSILDDMLCDLHEDVIDPLRDILRN